MSRRNNFETDNKPDAARPVRPKASSLHGKGLEEPNQASEFHTRARNRAGRKQSRVAKEPRHKTSIPASRAGTLDWLLSCTRDFATQQTNHRLFIRLQARVLRWVATFDPSSPKEPFAVSSIACWTAFMSGQRWVSLAIAASPLCVGLTGVQAISLPVTSLRSLWVRATLRFFSARIRVPRYGLGGYVERVKGYHRKGGCESSQIHERRKGGVSQASITWPESSDSWDSTPFQKATVWLNGWSIIGRHAASLRASSPLKLGSIQAPWRGGSGEKGRRICTSSRCPERSNFRRRDAQRPAVGHLVRPRRSSRLAITLAADQSGMCSSRDQAGFRFRRDEPENRLPKCKGVACRAVDFPGGAPRAEPANAWRCCIATCRAFRRSH